MMKRRSDDQGDADDPVRCWNAAARERRLRSAARRLTMVVLAVAPIGVGLAIPKGAGLEALDPPLGPIARTATELPSRAGPATADAVERQARAGRAQRRLLPSAKALRRARGWIGGRPGVASFAVVDSEGAVRGHRMARRYGCASVGKALLLAAELDRLKREELPLDPGTEALLRTMITWSDNDSADVIYTRVGDAGLEAVGRRAGMRRLAVGGHWASAQITAADTARFFARLDDVFARRHRKFALDLLGSVVPEQSWGIPAAAGDAWAVRFKGGWRESELGQLVHQGAELRERGGRRALAVAVLTDAQPSHQEGVATVAGTVKRLLD